MLTSNPQLSSMQAPPDLEVLITVHKQNIVLAFEKEKKFLHIKKYRYIFVGQGDVSEIKNIKNLIVARSYKDNIEDYKYFADYTGWYALVKNDVLTSSYIASLQYDTSIADDFENETVAYIKQYPGHVIGYIPSSMSDGYFLYPECSEPLRQSILNVYGLDIYPLIKKYVSESTDFRWQTSLCVAMPSEILRQFVLWFEPLFEEMKNFTGAGHAVERAIKIFCIIHRIPSVYLEGIAQHFQLNSHGTQKFQIDHEKYLAHIAKNEFTARTVTSSHRLKKSIGLL